MEVKLKLTKEEAIQLAAFIKDWWEYDDAYWESDLFRLHCSIVWAIQDQIKGENK